MESDLCLEQRWSGEWRALDDGTRDLPRMSDTSFESLLRLSAPLVGSVVGGGRRAVLPGGTMLGQRCALGRKGCRCVRCCDDDFNDGTGSRGISSTGHPRLLAGANQLAAAVSALDSFTHFSTAAIAANPSRPCTLSQPSLQIPRQW
jgi:hypothetical protein